MLQLVYISSPNPSQGRIDTKTILQASRRNNARDGITGLLFSDGFRFLQVLEGPEDAVEKTFARIQKDARHRAVVLLSKRDVAIREFGDWEMAERGPSGDGVAFVERIEQLVSHAAIGIRGTFEGLAQLKRTA